MTDKKHKTVTDSELPPLPIKERVAQKRVGPIGVDAYYCAANTMFGYSEVLVCDWLSRKSEWSRAKLVVRSPFLLKFAPEDVKDIQVEAWLCSFSDYITEDGGWALDWWNAKAIPGNEDGKSSCYIEATIAVAVRGISAKLNRVAYSWVAYVANSALPALKTM